MGSMIGSDVDCSRDDDMSCWLAVATDDNG